MTLRDAQNGIVAPPVPNCQRTVAVRQGRNPTGRYRTRVRGAPVGRSISYRENNVFTVRSAGRNLTRRDENGKLTPTSSTHGFFRPSPNSPACSRSRETSEVPRYHPNSHEFGYEAPGSTGATGASGPAGHSTARSAFTGAWPNAQWPIILKGNDYDVEIVRGNLVDYGNRNKKTDQQPPTERMWRG